MDTDDRQLLNARIGELVHWALVTIRAATWPGSSEGEDRRDEINDLADLLHNLPRYVVGHDEHAIDSAAQLRAAVVQHVRRFHPGVDPAQHQYVRLLDMDAETFLTQYRDHNWTVAVATAS